MNYLDPDFAYISISTEAGARLREMGLVSDGADFQDFRKVIIASNQTAREVDGLKSLHVVMEIDSISFKKPIYLLLVVNEGSPAGNKAVTTIIRDVLSENLISKMKNIGKGMTPLRQDDFFKFIVEDIEVLKNMSRRLLRMTRKLSKDPVQRDLYFREMRALNKATDLLEKLSNGSQV